MTTFTQDSHLSTGSKTAPWISRHALPLYFLLAFLGTWLMVAPLILSNQGAGILPFDLPDPVFLLIYVGAAYAGPAMAAFILTTLESGKPGVRKLLSSIFRWRVGVHWYLAALFGFLFIWLAVYSIAYRGAPVVNLVQNWQLLFSVFLPNVLLMIFIAGLGEEPGWRGYALPRLQSRYGALMGTAVLGLMHALWHLPVFFTPMLGPFTPTRYLTFLLIALAGSFLYTWVFNGTRGSVFIVVLMHAASNAASMYLGEIITDVEAPTAWARALGPDWLNVLAFGLAALLLIILTKGKLLYQEKPGVTRD